MSLIDIQFKIECLLYEYLIKDKHIIDEGDFFGNGFNYYYYIDNNSKFLSSLDMKQIKFLNETMELLSNLHTYIYKYAPENKKTSHPNVKLPLEEYHCDMDIMNDKIDSIKL
jgi:hypothetical protein